MSLNCYAVYVKMTYFTHEFFLTQFNFQCYVRYGHEHMHFSVRIFKELSPTQFSFEAASLFYHIGDLLFIRLIYKK